MTLHSLRDTARSSTTSWRRSPRTRPGSWRGRRRGILKGGGEPKTIKPQALRGGRGRRRGGPAGRAPYHRIIRMNRILSESSISHVFCCGGRRRGARGGSPKEQGCKSRRAHSTTLLIYRPFEIDLQNIDGARD